jgi:hypothetical protein
MDWVCLVLIGDRAGGATVVFGGASLGCGDDAFGRVYAPLKIALPATMKVLTCYYSCLFLFLLIL